MMGRFAFEVSQLSYLERRVAAALFANPPEATLDDALNHFILADEYAPFIWLENKLFIVKTLKLMKRNQKDIIAHLREANSVRDKLTDEVSDRRDGGNIMLRVFVTLCVLWVVSGRTLDKYHIDELLASGKNGAYEAAENLKKELGDQENPELLWRLAKVEHEIRKYEKKESKQEKLQKKALEYAERALALEDSNPEIHKWYAVALGGMTDFVSIKQKLKIAHTFEKEIRRALELNPNDWELHYLLGRFLFGTSQIGWFERKLATAIFGAPPTGTVEGAIDEFLVAERLSDGTELINKVFLAKAYLENDNYKSAVKVAKEGLLLEPKSYDETHGLQELEKIMKSYHKYA
ncbi:unnamed protein product [Cyprideis torosa]|uniref:Regulator of microtubule dynamics protein 1 n=1 Tax=Cyprideis torosa TaxID=163714 RepID=A0A7R8WD22_9CRUS|nr:unnamed protein product [Cyprideis torosa]CAG0894082.1 unnamed protein product [Cyprideis torosa]